MFERSVEPAKLREPFTMQGGNLAIPAVGFVTALWSWVASGFVTIPCAVAGTANAILLTPRFEPRYGASGFAHLLPFSFVAEASSTDTVIITVTGPGGDLEALPAYIAATPAGNGHVVAGVPYIAIYCDATGSLPKRIVLK